MPTPRPRFLVRGEPLPADALVVDADVRDTAGTVLSHWQGSPPLPPELVDDTSTGILARAARDPARWLRGYAWACNDHIDADGLLALALACRPELVAHAELLIGAAEAGDFTAWPGEAGFRLMLRLHQAIRDHRAGGAGWEQRCCEEVVEALPRLIAESTRTDPERDAAVAQVLAARAAIVAGDGIVVGRCGALVTVGWRERLGHAADAFNAVHRPDDCPLAALDGLVPPDAAQLLSADTGNGWRHHCDAPRHSWARTVRRPAFAAPDLAGARVALQDAERADCRWIAGPDARRLGFTCLLAAVDDQERMATSSLPPATVAAAISASLTRPR